MDIQETTRLCKAIAALAPAQKFDEETPVIWAMALADTRYVDAREAIINLAKRSAWIAPVDIIGEVRSIRRARLDGASDPVPIANPDDPAAYCAELAARRRAIADGAEYEPLRAISAARYAVQGPRP